MTISRLSKLSKSLSSHPPGSESGGGLDALLLNAGPSLVYLTGMHFHLSERPIIAIFAGEHEPVIFLPELEMLKVSGLPYQLRACPYGEKPDDWGGILRTAISTLNLNRKRIGVEPRQLRLLEYNLVRACIPEASFLDGSELISSLRARKDGDEIAAIRKAVSVAETSLEAAIPLVKTGMTEKELAAELVVQLLRHGSQPEMPFAPIVSSGPNSANPHAVPTERKLQPGDLLVVDWGAAVDGYVSDLTRTFAVGEPDAEFRKIHQIVLEANEAGRQAGKPGVPCAQVDMAARSVIEKAGYGEYFTHRTGHGIGMEGHEAPYLRTDNLQLLEEGMVYTVEPGIYLPDRNGVRIEDNMVITGDGADCLSAMPRELRIVG